MKKQLIFLFILILFLFIGGVFAEDDMNNSTYINNEIIIALEDGDSNISFEDEYKGYCAEWGEYSAEEGQEFLIKDTSQINNSNYLKTMFLFFYNQTQKDVYATQHMVWKFTDDKQFSRFNQTWYNQIIDVGGKYTIADEGKIPINNTHQFSFNFKSFIPLINEFQNFFAYQFLIEKIPSNTTIEINNTTNDNLNNTLPNYQNNNNYIEYNGIQTDSYIKNINSSTLNNINNHQTGINMWVIGCILVMLGIIFVTNKKK